MLQGRESAEIADTRTRAEFRVAQKKNLRIARFLNRIVFCLFAEDVRLLPSGIFREVCRAGLDDSHHFAVTLENLFAVMATGGTFGTHRIRHFNGHLFEDSTVFELTPEEVRILADASEADWQFIQPSIMGTLFERALEPSQRSQLGAHYTSEADIKTLVEPVLMAPLRREWAGIKEALAGRFAKGLGTARDRDKLAGFQKKLAATTVLDPACGSGNFLYVSLQLLLDLEKEVITHATQLGFKFLPRVGVDQLKAIEINPYAYELAQVSVQIGFLQWRRDNGFENDRTPVLQNLDGFQNEDALLVPHYRSKAKSLKEAQAGEHADNAGLRFYTERTWPDASVIIGNPPFLGGKFLRRELGDAYVAALFENYRKSVRPEADLCCYWFEKARAQITRQQCQRAGLLATQGIRGGASRDTLQRIKQSGGIFFAESDREWILAGANVHVSMVGFDNGSEDQRKLDGREVPVINANLSAVADVTAAGPLTANAGLVFMGDTKGGSFDVPEAEAVAMLDKPNPHGRPNSDVLVPWANGLDITRRSRGMWIIDFGPNRGEAEASSYEIPFAKVRALVRPARASNKREAYRDNWWRHVEARPGMLAALAPLPRFLATVRVAKHRLFAWLNSPLLPDCQLFAFASSEDAFFGIVHSRFHEVWALRQGTRLETRPRYTPTTCFETFPFPHPAPARDAAVAAAAKELNDLRERWLNPPEWTETRMLEFPGTVGGPWDRYIDRATVEDRDGFQVGTVRYPRLEPRNAECAAKLKKRSLTNLYNERPAWLDLAHRKLDAAVAAAYGWPAALTDEEILERLLALNLERAEDEAQAANKPKPRTNRAKREDELI
ncbi:MAG: class I SAM-dependent DNA methyltransferase [Verrucomicrobiales bacterium]|nr:class I SAM-dependent DNA methyltransferase [Verrucomicrobiales bacterium]